jgi:hypothetical protein
VPRFLVWEGRKNDAAKRRHRDLGSDTVLVVAGGNAVSHRQLDLDQE